MRHIQAVLASLTLLACGTSCVIAIGNTSESRYLHGSGVRVAEERAVAPFDSIDVSGGFELVVRAGEDRRLVVRGDDNLLPYVRTRVVEGRLVIDTHGANLAGQRPIEVEVTAPSLRALEVSGSCRFELTNVEAERFEVEVSGSSTGRASGRVGRLDIEVSGSAQLDFFELVAAEVDLDVSGSARVHVYAEERLHTEISGSAQVRYRGGPPTKVKIGGSGSVLPDGQ